MRDSNIGIGIGGGDCNQGKICIHRNKVNGSVDVDFTSYFIDECLIDVDEIIDGYNGALDVLLRPNETDWCYGESPFLTDMITIMRAFKK